MTFPQNKDDFIVYQNYVNEKNQVVNGNESFKDKKGRDKGVKPPKYIQSQSVNLYYMIFMMFLLVWTVSTSAFTM